MTLRFLPAEKYLDNVTQALKCMERQTDWKNQPQGGTGIIPMEKDRYSRDIAVEKVKIFKQKKHRTSWCYANDKAHFFLPSNGIFDAPGHGIIDDYQKKQDKNVLRNKRHVKNCAGCKKKHPTETKRYKKK
jgi:hypothetical protein